MIRLSLIALALYLAGCAIDTTAGRKTLLVVNEANAAGLVTFGEFDLPHQTAIVNAAPTYSAGQAELASYRNNRALFLKAAGVTVGVTRTARETLDAIDAGKKGDIPGVLAKVLGAAVGLAQAARAIGLPLPALDSFLGGR